jgi:transcriptional regulator with PAS, ATPase and Fis domain
MSDVPDLETQAAPATPSTTVAVRAAQLEVRGGPDDRRHAHIDRPNFTIGSGESADLRLADDTVSREHLRISLEPNGVRIRDEGSKNGTWLAEVRILEAVLTSDTLIRVGKTSIALKVDAAPLELAVSGRTQFGHALGHSMVMRHLFDLLERAAAADVTVLLEGESGVGKDVLARAIHGTSPRRDGPFVPVDCGAIPAALLESELFGHERGAFTSADKARQGLFEEANGGTIFLDEIGELPLDLQPKLLRVLEQREVRPVGARAARPVDVRVVAATNRRLGEASQRGEFRRDLFYRLSVARVTVPPLRDRVDDIVPLAQMFFRLATRNAAAELPPDLAAMLRAYAWPGNARELRNVIERYAVLGARDAKALFDSGESEGGTEASTNLPGNDLSALPYHEARRLTLEQLDRSYVPKILERAGGVVARAAELAELARPSLYRMMDRIGMDRSRDPSK